MSNGLDYFEKKGFVEMEEFQTFFVLVLTVRNLRSYDGKKTLAPFQLPRQSLFLLIFLKLHLKTHFYLGHVYLKLTL